MAIAITIPRLGWNMDEGTFAGWIKQDGEAVRAGDRVYTLEGEKATEEIESLEAGILRIPPDGPKAGDRVAVGAVIGYLAEPGEEVSFEREAVAAPEQGPQPAPAAPSPPAPRRRAAISPRARRVAGELGVRWDQLQGSGRGGRIRERDIRAAASQTAAPASSIRKAIADRMVASLRSTAPVTLTTTVDVANLVNLRNQFRAVRREDDIVPGYTDFVVKLSALALEQHPALSSRWDDGAIVPAARLDIGFAVDTEAGLLVPVLRDVPSLSLRNLAALARDLAERARRGALNASEMHGGVFTVTNLGAYGIDAFTPIINAPECAILGLGQVRRRPVADGDAITAREQMVLSLTFDHRIADGAPAARFLQTLVRLLENPGPWLMP